jgi:hypothetical protein
LIDTPMDQRGAIAFAEKVLELLDEGRYTATYKYAVLLALIDLCLEYTQRSGAPPEMLTTHQIADKIVEIYWPHTLPFVSRADPRLLRQNTGGQAEIVSAIMRFRSRHASDPSVPRWQSRAAAPEAYERLVSAVEWKLIEMPLPRLQMMGQTLDSFTTTSPGIRMSGDVTSKAIVVAPPRGSTIACSSSRGSASTCCS